MAVRIYKPAKTAMQSGTANTKEWVVEMERDTARAIDPLMGWTSSGDTQNQVRLTFTSKDEAIAFARKQGWAYTVREPKSRKPIKKTYADNFKFGRKGAWTH